MRHQLRMVLHDADSGLSPLTGNLVMRPLSPSTRSGSGPTGDFSNLGLFSPFSGTWVKTQIEIEFSSHNHAVCKAFGNFQTYGVFAPKIGFPKPSHYFDFSLVYVFPLALSNNRHRIGQTDVSTKDKLISKNTPR